RYFLNHPEQVLGSWSRQDTLYGEGYSVIGDGQLAEQLQAAIQRLPQGVASIMAAPDEKPPPRFTPPPQQPNLSEGSFFLRADGTICQLQDSQGLPVTYGGKTLLAHGTMTAKRLAALIGLRDKARRVLESQNEGWPEETRNDARRGLNWAYDRFVS